MKKTLILAAAALLLAACGGKTLRRTDRAAAGAPEALAASRSETAVPDADGTYTGTFPAADCPGIEMRLDLRRDGRYALHMKYIDRDASFDEKGRYTLHGDLLTLTPETGDEVQYYRLDGERLHKLDADRRPVTGALAGNYVLHKTRK